MEFAGFIFTAYLKAQGDRAYREGQKHDEASFSLLLLVFNSVSPDIMSSVSRTKLYAEVTQPSSPRQTGFSLPFARWHHAYAAVIRTCLSVSSSEGILERLMKWSLTAWGTSIVALYAFHADPTKGWTAIKHNDMVAVFLVAVRLRVNIYE